MSVAPTSPSEGVESEQADDAVGVREQLDERERQLDAVLRISRALSSRLSLDDVVTQTLEVSLETIGAGAGAVYLHDEATDELVFSYVLNRETPEAGTVLIGRRIRADQGIVGQVFRSGQASIVDDVDRNQAHLREIGQGTGYTTRNILTVPMVSGQGRTLGCLQALNKAAGHFDQDELVLLTILASQAATAIEKAKLYEEARAASIVHYLGDISHDIKNLITPAQTAAQTLEEVLVGFFQELDRLCENLDVEPRAREKLPALTDGLRALYPEMLRMVVESATETQERVREVADAVKGVIAEPVFEPYDVNEIILMAARTLKLAAERAGVSMHTHGLKDLPTVMVDRKRIYSAIYNLINNALPETPPGGSISLRSCAEPRGAFPEGGYLLIEVEDTGCGMPPAVRDRLFTNQAVSTKPGGTGLGTRIVRNAVEAHGGRVWVESEPGKGSTFYIKLPLEQPAARPA